MSDDFYTSNLAWSRAAQLAVALDNDVHLWSERTGQKHIPGTHTDPLSGRRIERAPITALTYSTNNKWLAVARKDGTIQIYCKGETSHPAECSVNGDIACVVFRPSVMSQTENNAGDVLLVGGHTGHIYYISVVGFTTTGGIKVVQCKISHTISSGHSEQVTYDLVLARRKKKLFLIC